MADFTGSMGKLSRSGQPAMKTEAVTSESLPLPMYRRALPWWLQGIVLLIVFVAGGAAGSMLTVRTMHGRMESYRQHAPIFASDIVARLRFRLALNEHQTDQVRHGHLLQLHAR